MTCCAAASDGHTGNPASAPSPLCETAARMPSPAASIRYTVREVSRTDSLPPAAIVTSAVEEPSTASTLTLIASSVVFASASTGAGPGGAAKRLGAVTSGAAVYQAKSDPSPKPVVCHTAARTGASADTSTVY